MLKRGYKNIIISIRKGMIQLKNVKFELDLKGKKAKKNLKKGLAVGTILGAAAGLVGGILFAPKAGKETRAQIKDNAADVSKKVADNVKEFTKKTGEVVKEKLNKCCNKEKDSALEQDVRESKQEEVLNETEENMNEE